MGDLERLLDQLADRIPNGHATLALGSSAFLPEVVEALDRLKGERDEARREAERYRHAFCAAVYGEPRVEHTLPWEREGGDDGRARTRS